MKDIDYISAQTLDEAVAALKRFGDRARVFAGGTDLIVQVREYRRDLDAVIDVKNIPELMALSFSGIEGLWLGAGVPCYRIYSHKEIAQAYPGLIDSVSIIGSVQIQGRASVGGNLCNASPAADTIPALIVHGATCRIYGPNGEREVPVDEFCTGPGQTVLEPDELLVSLRFPPPEARARGCYVRFTPRNEMDIAVAGAGAWVRLDGDGKTIVEGRVALSAVAPTPLPVPEIGDYLAGKDISEDVIHEAGEIARRAAQPITDMRGTTEQRRHLSAVLTRRALNGAIQRAREAQ